MQLLDTAPPPSPASKAAEKAKVTAPKIAAALPQARERFIPVSRYGLRAKLIAMLAEGGATGRLGVARSIASPPGGIRSIAGACST